MSLSGAQVDYEATMAAKLCLAKKVFDQFWDETRNSLEYQVREAGPIEEGG